MSDKKDQSMILCLHSQVSSLIKLIEEISIKKKKKKYGKTIEPIEKSIRQLAENAEDSALTATKFDEAYNAIILSLDCEFPRLKQVFMNEESTELQLKFEQIHNEYENEKLKKCSGIQEQSDHLTSEHPKKYNIYRIRQSITTIFGFLPSIQSNTNTSHSSSSSSSSQYRQKSDHDTKHYCLVWEIGKNDVTILVITSFNNKDPSIKGKNGVFPMLDRTYLLKRLISIGSTRELPGQKSITAFKSSNIPSDLHGYLVLMPTVAAKNVKWEDHYPYYFSQSDIMYINFRLAQLSKDIDIEDYSTSESNSSLPTSRLEFERINDWMMNNTFDNDDNVATNENDTSSPNIEIITKTNNDNTSGIDVISMNNEFSHVLSDVPDQLDHFNSNVDINSSVCLTNLTPIDVHCLVDNVEPIDLKSRTSNFITSRNKISLNLMIPSYGNTKWISDQIDLEMEKIIFRYEHFIIFRDIASDSEKILRMILRVDVSHVPYRLSLYSPFLIVNNTELKIEFQIGNSRMFISTSQTPVLVCPEKFESEADRNGQFRLYNVEQDTTMTNWSKKFSLCAIKSIDIVSCQTANDRTYMICVDILTSSSGLTKVITLTPAVLLINKSIISIEIIEIELDKGQNKWILVHPEQTIPFWPVNPKNCFTRIRYAHNHVTSDPFPLDEERQIRLPMNYSEYPLITVNIKHDHLSGIKVMFED